MNTPTPNTQARLRPVMQLSQRAQFEDLPRYWQQEVKSLRAENAKYRRERNDLRTELTEAQRRITGLLMDVADLKDGIGR